TCTSNPASSRRRRSSPTLQGRCVISWPSIVQPSWSSNTATRPSSEISCWRRYNRRACVMQVRKDESTDVTENTDEKNLGPRMSRMTLIICFPFVQFVSFVDPHPNSVPSVPSVDSHNERKTREERAKV